MKRSDERGVATYVGLMFAMLMVSAAWTTIGLGDAVLVKLRSQEAADSAVYSAAVTNAQGMNFVSMLNVSMLALTGTYMAAQNAAHIMEAATGANSNVAGWGQGANSLETGTVESDGWRVNLNFGHTAGIGTLGEASCVGDRSCPQNDRRGSCEKQQERNVFGDGADYCDVARRLDGARGALWGTSDSLKGIAGFKKYVIGPSAGGPNSAFDAMAEMQSSIATNQGGLGQYVGVQTSRTMMSGTGSQGQVADKTLNGDTQSYVASLCTKGKEANYRSSGGTGLSEGYAAQLPVTPHSYSALCGLLQSSVPYGGGNLDRNGWGAATNYLHATGRGDATRGNIVGVGMSRGQECGNGAEWTLDAGRKLGPLLMAGGAGSTVLAGDKALINGGVGMQSVAMVSSRVDAARTAAISGPFRWFSSLPSGAGGAQVTETALHQTRAQGEFFLHCAINGSAGNWNDPECNQNNLATFRLQWRARLTPMPPKSPALLASGLGGAAGNDSTSPAGGSTLRGGFNPLGGSH